MFNLKMKKEILFEKSKVRVFVGHWGRVGCERITHFCGKQQERLGKEGQTKALSRAGN